MIPTDLTLYIYISYIYIYIYIFIYIFVYIYIINYKLIYYKSSYISYKYIKKNQILTLENRASRFVRIT